jgi:hypothetical protein
VLRCQTGVLAEGMAWDLSLVSVGMVVLGSGSCSCIVGYCRDISGRTCLYMHVQLVYCSCHLQEVLVRVEVRL